MAKKKNNYKDVVVSIKKLRGGVNYRFTYDYHPKLSNYIKMNIPNEHRKVHVENVYNPTKQAHVDVWSRDIRSFSVGKVLSFIIDNSIKFKFVNMTESDIDELRKEFAERQNRIKAIMREKVDGLKTDDMDFSFMTMPPYEYQKQAIKFFEMNDGNAILADEMGVGKSLSGFAFAGKHNFKTLIICPASLKLNWKREVKQFLNQDTYVYKYNPPKRSKNVNYPKEDCNFHVINYESLDTYFKFESRHKCNAPGCDFDETNLENGYKECPLCHTPKSVKSRKGKLLPFEDKSGDFIDVEEYDLIILDECHYIKNTDAKRTKLIKKAFKEAKRKLLISGTPIKSRPMEFFSILNFLRPEEFNSSHDFGKKYCAGFEDTYGWKYDGASNLEELFERIQPFFIRRLKKDVLELPPKTFVNIPIQLTNKQLIDYQKVEEGVIEQLEGEDNSGEKKTALQIILELKRFVSEIKSRESVNIIKDIIDQGEKIVVFSEFQDTAEYINNYFGDQCVMIHGGVSTDERDEAVQKFQDANSEVKVFSGTIGAAGVGLTLTRASNLIFIGSAWTTGDMEQAEDRIHRASTTADKVTIMTLYCEDTIDEYIMEILDEKSKVVSKTLDNKVKVKNIESTGKISQKESDGSILNTLIGRLLGN